MSVRLIQRYVCVHNLASLCPHCSAPHIFATVWAGGMVTTNSVVRRLFYYFFDVSKMFTSTLQGLDADVLYNIQVHCSSLGTLCTV